MGVHTGAEKHLNNNVLLTMDIKNFFNSVKIQHLARLIAGMSHRLIKRKIIKETIYLEDDLAHGQVMSEAQLICVLCCYKGQLPQGAPTSPALANLFAMRLDGALQTCADANDLIYTRYADDITLSHKDSKLDIGKYVQVVEHQLEANGLKANYKKTRILRPHRRMVVTGVVINDKLGVPKYKWKNLRAKIHNLKRDNRHISLKEYQQIRGYCEWIKLLNPTRGQQLVSQLSKIPLQGS
jgi:hypothetical protein